VDNDGLRCARHILITNPETLRMMGGIIDGEPSSEDELEPVKAFVAGMRSLFPREHGDCDIISVVDGVSRFEVLGRHFYALKLGLFVDLDSENQEIRSATIYIREENCKAFSPKIGDAVRGVIWLQGTVNLRP
jgi:hypothetical protein